MWTLQKQEITFGLQKLMEDMRQNIIDGFELLLVGI